MVYFWVLFAQISFNLLKVLEIRYTFEHDVTKLLINSVFIGLMSLASMFISIDALLKGNFFIIFFYLFGGLVGKYFGMKIKVTKPVNKLEEII
jgi:uncharacterized membrane protein YqgA involved in biofilm formation